MTENLENFNLHKRIYKPKIWQTFVEKFNKHKNITKSDIFFNFILFLQKFVINYSYNQLVWSLYEKEIAVYLSGGLRQR